MNDTRLSVGGSRMCDRLETAHLFCTRSFMSFRSLYRRSCVTSRMLAKSRQE